MKIVQIILDFILAMARVFRPGNKKGRKFCVVCGSLLGPGDRCSGCGGTDGSGPGSSGSDSGVEEKNVTRLLGWALILIAVGNTLF